MMSKKHFELFANSIKATTNATDAERLADVCIGMFKADNARFDAARFYAACGLNAIGERDGVTFRYRPTGAHVAIMLNAKHDTNGNPRRVYVVLDAVSGDMIDAIKDYCGIQDLYKSYPGIGSPCEFPTTPGEYRSLLKIGEKLRAKREGGTA